VSGDPGHATRQPNHVDRRVHRTACNRKLEGAVAYLAGQILAPALSAPGGGHDAIVKAAHTDLGHTTRQCGYVMRLIKVKRIGIPRAYLTDQVVSPALHTAGAGQCARITQPAADLDHTARQPNHINGRGFEKRGAPGHRVVTQLTLIVPPPALDASTRAQRTCKSPASTHPSIHTYDHHYPP